MTIRIASAALWVMLSVCTPASAGIRTVWAVGDGEKVERDDLAHPLRERNMAWDGRTARIFGARNEVLAFQLIVEAGDTPIGQLSVSLPELRSASGSAITYGRPALDPTDTAGRPIQIFTVHYMHVTEPSRASWVYEPGSPAAPRDPTGWKPVQLVPEQARAGRGGLPVSVAARQNQSIWIEVYTGRDRPAGMYRGTVTIGADGESLHVPIELELFDFALPDDNTMHAMVYYEGSQPERYHGRNLDAAYHRLAHRHRIELVHAYDRARVEREWGRFSGDDFTPAAGYEGPGERRGNMLVPASFYTPGDGYDDRASAWARADAWMSFLAAKLPEAITFLYMPDEPRPSEYPRIRALADNVHSNPGPGGRLPIFVTSTYAAALDGAIDIWCAVTEMFDVDRAARERARGRQYWFYNGMRPAAGAMTIDSPATDPRANIWAAFKHDVRVYFYWHGVHWRHNSQMQGERNQNVWADSITFDNRGQPNKPVDGQGFIHGDGVLMYPGEDRLHLDQDRGLPGPVATVQLANLRRGLQDHQYLTLARAAGLDAAVDQALKAIVPAVLSDAGETVSFPESGDAYDAMRLKLARAIGRRSVGP